MEIIIGTCGFSGKGGRKNYYQVFRAVELQETFYRVISEETLTKWRKESPEDFEFTIKAFQGITHPPSSPTWRRARGFKATEDYGFFKPTQQVLSAWEYTKRAAHTLKSSFIVFQTPPSFTPTSENVKNLEFFFNRIERDNLVLGWEPRGAWYEDEGFLADTLARHRLVHVVDPFRHTPLSKEKIYYFRLHGIGKGEVNYSYKYTDYDLKKLISLIESLTASRVYVFFNNIQMFDDALRLKKMIERL
ncbi:MAG: DUF72 domain-containing protein [Infirmifilum sp.]